MFFTEVARHDHAQRITMPMRQSNAVHVMGEQSGRFHRLLQRDRVGVIINTMKTHPSGVGKRRSSLEQIAQRHTSPDSVTDEARLNAVADAHYSCLLPP